jgi:adenine deaminase
MAIICETALRLRLIATAQELAAPDLLVRGGRVWNVYTGEIGPADIAICGDRIAKVGSWTGPLAATTQLVEADGHIALPGYIEPHTHPWPFANPLSLGELAVSRGTTCLVYDQLMLNLAMGPDRFLKLAQALSTASLPHVFWVARIASQSRFGNEDEYFGAAAIRRQLESEFYLGSAELTRWPDLLDAKRAGPLLSVLEETRRVGKINDGHLAGASPRKLAALATTGIRSCHEAIIADEALERLRLGLWVLLRNSSLREDLGALLPFLNRTAFHDRIAFTTDGAAEPFVDELGIIDHLIALALEAGVSHNIAYRLATLNPATFLRLEEDLGAVAPGRIANINLLSSLDHPLPKLVVCRGRIAARDGHLVVAAPSADFPWTEAYAGSSPDIPEWGDDRFILPLAAPNPFPAANLVNAAITREVPEPLATRDNGQWPTAADALVVAVTDRGGHWITRGIVKNVAPGLEALATTYTTSVGVLVLGKSPQAMAQALARLKRLGGGTVLMKSAGEWAEFPFPMAGIHATGGFAEGARAARAFQRVMRACGYCHSDPKYTLLFLTCDMLPEVRATEAGWVRVKTNQVLYPAERLTAE